MFDTLSDKLQASLGDLRGHGRLSEENLSKAMREIRLALLEADVAALTRWCQASFDIPSGGAVRVLPMTGAVMMTLAWLMLGRFALGKRKMTRSDLDRTLLLWAVPLLIAPLMISKDVYSYLAQSEIPLQRNDPYRVGPAPGLGLDHVFTMSVPSLWRETPAPYGPLFLWIGLGISALTGENIVEAVLSHRLVVLLGVGMIVWATPRLARRCSSNPFSSCPMPRCSAASSRMTSSADRCRSGGTGDAPVSASP